MTRKHVVLAWAMLALVTLGAAGAVLSKGPAVTPAWASNEKSEPKEPKNPKLTDWAK